MKKLSTTALVIAAGMASSAQAVDFEVDDRTTLSVFGAVELGYKVDSTIENSDPDDSSTESTSDIIDNGSVIGVGAEHRFESGLTAYVSTEFAFNMLGAGADEFARDESYVGLRGNFGDVRIGQYDNLFILATYDLLDPFENVSLGEEPASEDNRTIAYFSPDYNGFSYQLQTRVVGDSASASNSDEYALIGVVNYEADRWSLHAAVDDRGTEVDADGDDLYDPSYGVGATLAVTDRLGLAARYSVADEDPSDDDADTAYYGALVTFDYGAGELYGGVQEIDPDEGDGQTQFAAGANYFVEDNLYVYGEYGSFDQPNTAGGAVDARYQVGAVYEF